MRQLEAKYYIVQLFEMLSIDLLLQRKALIVQQLLRACYHIRIVEIFSHT